MVISCLCRSLQLLDIVSSSAWLEAISFRTTGTGALMLSYREGHGGVSADCQVKHVVLATVADALLPISSAASFPRGHY